MNLVLKPNKHSCIIAAFAAAARVTPEYLVKRIGHNGSKVVDGLPIGYHPQEIIEVLDRAGVTVTPIEMNPISLTKVDGELYPINFKEGNEKRFDRHVERTRHGVILCKTKTGTGHAVAVDGYEGVVYDPDGDTYPYSELKNQGLEPFILWKLRTV